MIFSLTWAAILNQKRLLLETTVSVNQIKLKMNLTSYFIAPFTMISEMPFSPILVIIFFNFTTMDQDEQFKFIMSANNGDADCCKLVSDFTENC